MAHGSTDSAQQAAGVARGRNAGLGNSGLAGRTALVTGASRGIGAAVARALAARGVRVALVARTADRLEAVAREIQAGGSRQAALAGASAEPGENAEGIKAPDALIVPCDLTDPTAVHRMAEHVSSTFHGPPDIIVNNAGVFDLAPLHEVTEAMFVATIQTNLTAPFLVMRAFLGALRTRGSGDLVTIGSIADRNIMPENGAYAAAKFGLRAMHEVLRQELRGTGVRASLVSPGAVDTELWDELLESPGDRMLPTRDVMLNSASVAEAVLYVLSQPASVNIDELRLSRS